MKREFDFKFLNKIMYLGVAIILFYVLKNLGIIDKFIEVNGALIPVYIGLLICFITMPIAKKFCKWGLNKKWSAICSLVVVYLTIAIVFALIIPIFIEQISSFINNFPEIYKEVVSVINDIMHNHLGIEESFNISTDIKNLGIIKDNMDSIVSYSFNTVQSIFGFIISLFTTLIVSFFLVKDMEDIRSTLVKWFSKNGKNKKRVKLFNEVEDVALCYAKGITLDSIVVGILTAIVCFVLKIDYAIVFGLLITILNFIPYIGALLSEVIIALYAITIGGPLFGLLTFVMLLVIQIIDANILQPNIVAKSVDLHPVVVFVGLIVGNLIFGMWGMIIAVPILGIIKTVIRYKSSKQLIEE